MHGLNQNQMVLLVLLVSFVTSIATGIMTVSLLQQAPVEVTRNINSIVEKTIEKVVPSSISGSIINPQKDVTTVVIKEEDLIISSINKNIKSVVRISETDTVGTKSFYGIGAVLNVAGVIGTDRKTISYNNIYIATFSDGTEYKLTPIGVDKKTNSMFFKVNFLLNVKYLFYPAKISTTDLQLGQTVIGLGGDTKNTVAVGRVSSFVTKDSGVGTTTTKYVSGIETDVSTKDMTTGSPFFNLSGDLVGMKLSQGDSASFIPISIIYKELNTITQ